MWDPSTYLRYGGERGRPYAELLARVGAQSPRRVVDLGCGPGTLTAQLLQRWPGADVEGIDSSVEMIDKARSSASRIQFRVGDVRDWRPGPDVDVVVSNATLHWVPEHAELLARWACELNPGSWLAVQVPGNFDLPSHRALRAVAAQPHWRGRLAPLVRDGGAVLEPTGYVSLLRQSGSAVDAWETTYVHLLETGSGRHPVLRWMEGTALRPVRAVLQGPGEWERFCDELESRLAPAYPAQGDVIAFPFRRIFFVARTATTHARGPGRSGP